MHGGGGAKGVERVGNCSLAVRVHKQTNSGVRKEGTLPGSKSTAHKVLQDTGGGCTGSRCTGTKGNM